MNKQNNQPKKSPPRRVASPKKIQKSPPRKLSSPAKIAARKGPIYHANDFKVGHQMVGQDGQMWYIKMITRKDGTKYKRWVRL